MRIRKKLGIKCVQKKKYKATTNSKHTLPVAGMAGFIGINNRRGPV